MTSFSPSATRTLFPKALRVVVLREGGCVGEKVRADLRRWRWKRNNLERKGRGGWEDPWSEVVCDARGNAPEMCEIRARTFHALFLSLSPYHVLRVALRARLNGDQRESIA